MEVLQAWKIGDTIQRQIKNLQALQSLQSFSSFNMVPFLNTDRKKKKKHYTGLAHANYANMCFVLK